MVAATEMPPPTANSPRLWFTSLVAVVELPEEEVEGVAIELLVAAMKGPKISPCFCVGVVLFEVLAALALKMVRISDVLEL